MSATPEYPRPAGEESLHLLSVVGHTLDQRIEDALREVGSGVEQWRVLGLLAEHGGCPMTVVAEHAMLLPPKASKLVDRMVAANLVQRRADLEDRRRVLVAATARGRAALAEWDRAAAGVLERYAGTLGPDAEIFTELLRRLWDGLRSGRTAVVAADRAGGA